MDQNTDIHCRVCGEICLPTTGGSGNPLWICINCKAIDAVLPADVGYWHALAITEGLI